MNENQVGVVLEEVRDMFKTLGEGQKVLENKIDSLENRMDSMENRMDRIESDVSIIKSYVMKVDDTLNDHEKRITTLEKKIAL